MKRWLCIALCVCSWLASESPGRAHADLLALIGRLTDRISTNQNDIDVLLERADLYRLHTNWAAARSDYATVQKLAPDSIPLLLGLAQLHLDLGENAAARAAFGEAAARCPTNAQPFFGRAIAFTRLGDRKAAIADYSRGLALTTAPQPDQYLERASLQTAEAGPLEAIKGLDEGLARLGWAVTLQRAAIDLELKCQQPDQALARLETIVARANRKEMWLAWKGEILRGAGRTNEAQQVLSAALKEIDRLPPRMRTSTGMIELRAKVEKSLSALPIARDSGKTPAENQAP